MTWYIDDTVIKFLRDGAILIERNYFSFTFVGPCLKLQTFSHKLSLKHYFIQIRNKENLYCIFRI